VQRRIKACSTSSTEMLESYNRSKLDASRFSGGWLPSEILMVNGISINAILAQQPKEAINFVKIVPTHAMV
jgi:hypothetical protein